MKKIGLLSDTHGYFDPKIKNYFDKVDEIWHAGDIGDRAVITKLEQLAPVRAVQGNIDDASIQMEFPIDLFFNCETVKVWMTHIGGYPGRYPLRVRNYLAKNPPPDLFIDGHSHILKVMKDPKYNFLHMNPGAAGFYGFHQVKTILRFEIDGSIIQNLEAIELGARGF